MINQETRTLGNRRRLWNGHARLTELLNTPVQGTAADIIKKALALLPTKLQVTGSKIIACVHDEIVLEVPESCGKETSIILEQTMIQAGNYYLKKVPIEVDVSIADSWAGK